MKSILLAITMALAIALPITASAPNASASPGTKLSPKETACQKARKMGKPCVINFGQGDDIDGAIAAPDGSDVIVAMESLFGGLITLRYDFRDRIIAAADDL